MATQGNYYLDAATLTLATAVYTDAGLTTLAPDGFYGDGSIAEQWYHFVIPIQALLTLVADAYYYKIK
jgi:hypothetical protein